jgi:peptidoglycan hydrolase-like protein with peptidoglycan-binding domain
MGQKVIKLTESDLTNIVRKVIAEQNQMSGQEVYELQTALNEYFKMKNITAGGKVFQIPVDSKWGKLTSKALEIFQKYEKINPDGIPGPQTYDALHKLGLNQDIIDKALTFIGKLF